MSEVPRKPPQSTRDYDPSFEPLLDSDEAAALLKIHPRTLQRMARRGEIPGIQIGKLWRFRASTLNGWMNDIGPHECPAHLNLERKQG
jgi:excisionase family DNA binding protein